MTQPDELKKAQENYDACARTLNTLVITMPYDASDGIPWDDIATAHLNASMAASKCGLIVAGHKAAQITDCPQCQREIEIRAAFGSPKVPWTCIVCRKEHEQ